MGFLADMRHGRGFGVHSPWAYTMVMDVLRQKAAYYRYGDVDALFARKADRRVARAVFRILVSLRPGKVTVAGPPEWEKVVGYAGSAAADGPELLLVANPDSTDAKSIIDRIGPDGIAVIIRNSGYENLISELNSILPHTHGYILDTVRSLAIINLRHDLPRQYLRARW